MKTWILWVAQLVALAELLQGADDSKAPLSQDHTALETRANELNKQVLQAYRQGNVKEAIRLATEVVNIQRLLHKTEDHSDLADSLNNLAYFLLDVHRYDQALPLHSEALDMYKRLHKGHDHPHVARALNDMGYLLQQMGRYDRALQHYTDGLEMRKRLYKGQDHSDVAISLSNTSHLLKALGKYEQAMVLCEGALQMKQRLYNNQDHSSLAISLSNMGGLFQAMGNYNKALQSFTDGVEMHKRLQKGKDDATLASSLDDLGGILQAMGQNEKALPLYVDALEMRRRLCKNRDHADLARSLNNMGYLLKTMGQYEKALPFYADALEMRRRLHKGQDNPDVAVSLNNMAGLLRVMGRHEKALAFCRDALDMRKRLYKGQDHPQVASSLNNVGFLLRAMGEHEKALPVYAEALQIHERLHKDRDDPDYADSMTNMAYLVQVMGQYDKALPYYSSALEMRKRLHKSQDHAQFADTLSLMGKLHQIMGRHEKALSFYSAALEMRMRLRDRVGYAVGLVDAMNYLTNVSETCSGLLSAASRVPERQAAVHEVIWTAKADLGQVFRSRQELAIRQQSKEMGELLDQLQVTQRRLSGILSGPVSRKGDVDRDRQLQDLSDEEQRLERGIAKLLPERVELTKLELSQLTASLGTGDVFVDLYRYYDCAAGKGQQTHCYVAFVATKDSKSMWVHLGSAKTIDDAALAWRQALEAWSPKRPPPERRDILRQAEQHASILRRQLWEPIEKQLPSNAKRIYISSDGDLSRVPFAALPSNAPGAVLLERYAIAYVESGPFLLKHLGDQKDTSKEAGVLLLAGGVRYDPRGVEKNEPWPYLEGSERERRQVLQLWAARAESIIGSGHDATSDWLVRCLPKARYAHLATHGEFKAAEFARERLRLEEATIDRLSGIDRFRKGLSVEGELGGFRISAGGGVRSPLGYVGIVMAGANQPPEGSPDRGIVTGTTVWPLNLSKMELAVLSACETGLGANTGGAGVQNLQLAFHVAGCRNVVASLWRVDDDATAALMSKFYHELWQQGKPPIEALRDAQLLVMRRPDLVEKLSGGRGRLEVEKAVRVESSDAMESRPEDRPDRLPAKYWAAFVLSGVGR